MSDPAYYIRQSNVIKEKQEVIKSLERDLEKPEFTSCLDHLGPTTVYYLGIDEKYGILVGDETYAISVHLRPKALK